LVRPLLAMNYMCCGISLAALLCRQIRDPYGPAAPPSNHGRDLP
jgi:hypothetical protein